MKFLLMNCLLICKCGYLLLLSTVSVHAQLTHKCVSVIPLFTWLYAVGLIKPAMQGISAHFSRFQRFIGTGFCLLCLLRPKMVLFIVTTRNVCVCYVRKQCLVYCHFPSCITFVHSFHSLSLLANFSLLYWILSVILALQTFTLNSCFWTSFKFFV